MVGTDGFGGACNTSYGDLEVCACSNKLRIKSLIPLFLPADYDASQLSMEKLIIDNKLECLYQPCTQSNRVYKESKFIDGNYCPNTFCVQFNDIDITTSKIGSLVNKQECGLGLAITKPITSSQPSAPPAVATQPQIIYVQAPSSTVTEEVIQEEPEPAPSTEPVNTNFFEKMTETQRNILLGGIVAVILLILAKLLF
jgi:hypothetical protein